MNNAPFKSPEGLGQISTELPVQHKKTEVSPLVVAKDLNSFPSHVS